jgi:hypothetical protein
MKTKIIITGWLAIIISSCTAPKYLPSSEKIGINEYGSYIKIFCKNAPKVFGELIAIEKII